MTRIGKCFLSVLALACSSCATFEESGLPGSASSMAKNKIMLVRDTPPSLGYFRLEAHKARFRDLEFFLRAQGRPDFLAEAKNRDQHYLIMYYLNKRQAFACRGGSEKVPLVEFSGPYAITDREYQTLERLKKARSL